MEKAKSIPKKFSFTKKSIATIVAAVIFVIFAILVMANVLGGFDNAIRDTIISTRGTGWTDFAKSVTSFLNPYFIAVLLFLLAAFGPGNHPAFSGLLCVGGGFLLNEVVKVIFARPRPVGYRLIVETGYSFPSGHAVVAMALFGFIIWLIWQSLKDRKVICWTLTVIFSFVIFSVGFSRIYLGVHFASDVIAGWCLGFIWLSFFTSVCAPRLQRAPLILSSTTLASGTSWSDKRLWSKEKRKLQKRKEASQSKKASEPLEEKDKKQKKPSPSVSSASPTSSPSRTSSHSEG